MKSKTIDPNAVASEIDLDWEGNNLAVKCVCGKVFLVSEQIHGGERTCPFCGKTKAMVQGGRKSGGKAMIQFEC
ncbi:MAG: hypothetical protein EBS84_17045 [Proteobacteria bacterium]|nr:hypothetical protein [Verrucomicrobiota bacterium]NBU10700.1 hypothetical protein [Pseudomonadota bacterium]